ncbi:hypothetical protein COV11_03555 [Candidatus Woesearchaeota archaeon CG10_big_fil_rev_8_21_14_0_10_30_7]|nr:MAG: hypothetical protein COV11_03555 [Candidatus Woesearchaeota archaeon CG10_big_fil_rev_8_21_14_0_10_30_7]
MEKYAIFILVIVLIFGVTGILFNSVTGQSYRYAQNFGPQGQQPSYVNDVVFGLKFPYERFPTPSSNVACCSFPRIAEFGNGRCPLTQEAFDAACAVGGEEDAYVFPPCPPNHLTCNFPR